MGENRKVKNFFVRKMKLVLVKKSKRNQKTKKRLKTISGAETYFTFALD